jgi:dethiobiotin synthetase
MTARSLAVSTRIFIVGTDTAVGKTAVTAALLHTARARGLKVVPFKPAQSGRDRPSDAERLLAAAGLPADALALACPLRYEAPLAPGVAEDPAPFVRARAVLHDPTDDRSAVIARCAAALAAWESQHQPALTLIEGAGGLYVPMPGGTWQPAWITALAPWTLVVGRAGLGAINHGLLTIAGLRALGRPPLGFVLSQTSPGPDTSGADPSGADPSGADPSVTTNAAIIASAAGIPHLGTLPHGPEPALAPALLDALLARLGR